MFTVSIMLKFVVLSAVIALAVGDAQIGLGSFSKNNSPFDAKIVGGTAAKLGQFPYQVSLHLKGPTNSRHYCGGSIIAPNAILTAGHCVTEVNIGVFQHIEVLAGLVNFDNPGIQAQNRKVIKTIVHPDFPGGVAPNDVAIHILDEPFNFNLFANKINLPTNGSSSSSSAVLSGWGSTSTTSSPSMPTVLQTATLDIISYEECAAAVDGSDAPLDETMICTSQGQGSGACSGDSGGPLVTGTTTNRVLIGVVSWGFIPCGQEGLPSVFTDVSRFVDFINESIA